MDVAIIQSGSNVTKAVEQLLDKKYYTIVFPNIAPSALILVPLLLHYFLLLIEKIFVINYRVNIYGIQKYISFDRYFCFANILHGA